MFDLIRGRGRSVFASRDSVIYLFNLFRFVGLNPPPRCRFLNLLYGSIIAFFNIFLSPLIFNVNWMRDMNTLSIMELLIRVQGTLNVILIPIKSAVLIMYLGRLRSIAPLLVELDSRYTAPEDVAKIRSSAITCNRIVFAYIISYNMYVVSVMISALFGGHLPLKLWIPYLDWQRSAHEYWLQFGYDATLFFLITSYQTLNDCYSPVYIYIIRTQVQLLANRVKRLGTAANKNQNEVYHELQECIMIHQGIFRVVRIVEPAISFTMFVQFLVTAAILGTTMINIFIYADATTRIFSASYFMCVLLQISPICYHATHLQSDCQQLSMSIFHCNWIEQDKRFNKALIYFLQRSQAEIPLYALKLIPINLSTSLSIVRFSFTVYTFIQQLAVGKNLKE